jgi:hypothetical protein
MHGKYDSSRPQRLLIELFSPPSHPDSRTRCQSVLRGPQHFLYISTTMGLRAWEFENSFICIGIGVWESLLGIVCEMKKWDNIQSGNEEIRSIVAVHLKAPLLLNLPLFLSFQLAKYI